MLKVEYMMGRSYKVGEFIYASGNHYDGMGHDLHSGYGVITNIIDNRTGEFYDELNVITGHGDKNTKVTFKIDLIAQDYNFRTNITQKIKIFDNPIKLSLDPHHVFKYTFEEFIGNYNEALENLNEKMELFKKYRYTRDDKLNNLGI